MTKLITNFILFFVLISNAQTLPGLYGETNWFNNWTNFKPKTTEYTPPTRIISGEITTPTTLKKGTYSLIGSVYVTNGAVLTLEPGVVIRADSDSNATLIITKGSKIMAIGTETDPILFTSAKPSFDRKPGDWGGIILYGDAPVSKYGGQVASIYDSNPKYNLFGGTNENSNSGTLKYVRIEFAGKKINDKITLNGLTLAGVGKTTKLDYIQVSLAKDDAFEIVGGVVEMNNVISFQNADDDFDFSMGTQATMNNCIAIRNPYISDNTRSRVFEIDTYDKIQEFDPTRKKTLVKLNHVTMVSNEENTMGLVKEAISVKTDSFLEMNKCVVAGFAALIALEEKFIDKESYKLLKITNTLTDSCTEWITNEALQKIESANEWFLAPEMKNTISKTGNTTLFKSNDIKKKPDFRLK